MSLVIHIPENILKGNWRVMAFVPEEATPEQEKALLGVWTGKLGGPVADLAGLVGELVDVKRAPITFTVECGKGTLKIGDVAQAVMQPFQSATNRTTTLVDTVFSTIPGSPAFVSKASEYRRSTSQYGFKDIYPRDHNAIQGNSRFEA